MNPARHLPTRDSKNTQAKYLSKENSSMVANMLVNQVMKVSRGLDDEEKMLLIIE
jgi:hypothetical protein